jgi:replicative DNA helicase
MDERIPPQDIPAEQAALGACLLSPSALAECRRIIRTDDWYRPAHATIWREICLLADLGEPVDACILEHRLRETGELDRVGGAGYIVTLMQATPTAVNAAYYAEMVTKAATQRHLVELHTRGLQRAYDAGESSVSDLIRAADRDADQIRAAGRRTGPLEGFYEYGEHLALHANQPDSWVIPGAIAREDVWMILSPPGSGKTTLSRQLCWALAVGVHPWDHSRRIEAVNTLLVDLENARGMAADESVHFYARYNAIDRGTEGRSFLWSRPSGINLRDPDDENQLDQAIGDSKAQFVALGSLYKAFTRSGNEWDVSANEARAALDRLRHRHQVAFWIENHMPKPGANGLQRTVFGSAVWEFWASHGRVLERAVPGHPNSPYRFTSPFRGDRGKRECPAGFLRGGPYPWEPVMDQRDLDARIELLEAR